MKEWETVEVCVRGTAEGNPFAERMVEGIIPVRAGNEDGIRLL
jgi:hypothetical protein